VLEALRSRAIEAGRGFPNFFLWQGLLLFLLAINGGCISGRINRLCVWTRFRLRIVRHPRNIPQPPVSRERLNSADEPPQFVAFAICANAHRCTC